MFAAGSRAEVTAPFKHANLPRSNLLLFFLASGLLKMRGKKRGPWRTAEWKLGAAFRKEVRTRYDGQTKVITSVWNWGLCDRGRLCSEPLSSAKPEVKRRSDISASSFPFLPRRPWPKKAARQLFCISARLLSFSSSETHEGKFCFGDQSTVRLSLNVLLVCFCNDSTVWRRPRWSQRSGSRGSHEVETCKVKSSEPAPP